MSPLNCSKLSLAGALVVALAGCARQVTPGDSGTPVPGSDKVGFVYMDELVKKHPLYAQLAHLDEDMQALQLKSVGPDLAQSGADISKQEHVLQKELETAADRTNKALQQKQQEYTKREQAAIAAALAAAGVAGAPSGSTISTQMANVSRDQAQRAAQAAQSNLDAYRKALIDQDNSAAQTLQHSLADRANRTYRARAEELQKNEADYAYQLASADSVDRLSLRTLDDASRDDVKKQLDALDQKESDALGAMKNRDQATLLALQKSLHTQIQGELTQEVEKLRARTIANINKRTLDTRTALVGQISQLNGPAGKSGVALPANVAPDLRAKLTALHQKFASDYKHDAMTTLQAFAKTRADITKRFQDLAGADGAAQSSAGREMDALQKQRVDLYQEMVAQIGREVKTIAARRGIAVVVSAVVAPAGGVDLTTDAEKDIESLHE
jgi:hypothetical protein